MVDFYFDTKQVPDEAGQQAYELIPAGTYQLMVKDSAWKDGKDGKRLVMQYLITEGDYRGRVLFEGFNIKSASSDAVRIAKRMFKKVMNACGKKTIYNTTELHGCHIEAEVVIKGKYNNLRGHRPRTKAEPIVDESPEFLSEEVELTGADSDDIPF